MTDIDIDPRPLYHGIAIEALYQGVMDGSVARNKSLPDLYAEVERAVDPYSADGQAFHAYCSSLLDKLQPDRDKSKIQFVLLDDKSVNGYILPYGEPVVIALTKGLVEYCRNNEGGLAWVIGHEYTHYLSHLQREDGHGRKLEEAIADTVPLQWLHDAGYSRMAAVRFISEMFLNNGPIAAETRNRLTFEDAKSVKTTLQDAHFRDAHRVAALSDEIAGIDIATGQNSAGRENVPMPPAISNMINHIYTRRFIDTRRDATDYHEANPLEQMRILLPLIEECSLNRPWRAQEFKEALSEVVDEYQRFDWQEAGRDVDEVDEEFSELGNQLLKSLKSPRVFNTIYPVLAKELHSARTPMAPVGVYGDIAKGMEGMIQAKSQGEFNRAYESIKDKLPQTEGLPTLDVEWPRFSTGIHTVEDIYRTRDVVTPVPWNNQSEWAQAYARTHNDDGALLTLMRMGAFDPRMRDALSNKSLESVKKMIESESYFRAPDGYQSMRMNYALDEHEGKEVLIFDGFTQSPSLRSSQPTHPLLSVMNKLYLEKPASNVAKDQDDFLNEKSSEAKLAETSALETGDDKSVIAAIAANNRKPKLIEFWPENNEEFVATFPEHARKWAPLLTTPEILQRDPQTDSLARVVRALIPATYGSLNPDDFERDGKMTEKERHFITTESQDKLQTIPNAQKLIPEALDIIDSQIYPSFACRESLKYKFDGLANKANHGGAAELIRSFYLGRDDGLDYDHFFKHGMLVEPSDRLGSIFWGDTSAPYTDVDSAIERGYDSRLVHHLFSIEEKLNFVEKHYDFHPGKKRFQRSTLSLNDMAYPVDDKDFWEKSIFPVLNEEPNQKDFEKIEADLIPITERGYTGHLSVASNIYHMKYYDEIFTPPVPEPAEDSVDKDVSAKEIQKIHEQRDGYGDEDEDDDHPASDMEDEGEKLDLDAVNVLNLDKDIPHGQFLIDHSRLLSQGNGLSTEIVLGLSRTFDRADQFEGSTLSFAKILTLVDHYELITHYPFLKEFKQTTLNKITNEPDAAIRTQALDHLLYDCSIKDVGLHRQLVKLWVKEQQNTLKESGLPAIDDGSPAFKEKLAQIIAKSSEIASGSARYEMLKTLAESLETQRDCSRMMKDIIFARTTKSIKETESSLQVGEATLTVTDAQPELRNAIVKFLCNEATPELTADTARIARRYMIQANQVGHSQVRTNTISYERVGTSLRNYHDNYWNLPLPARAMVMSQLLLPAHSRDYGHMESMIGDNQKISSKKTSMKKAAEHEYQQAFDSVVQSLFPETALSLDGSGQKIPVKFSAEAREMLDAYDTMLKETNRSHMRPVLLAVLMSASQQSQHAEEVNIGERLALVLEMMGTAEIKTGQLAGGHKDTPREFAEGLQRLKDRADPPSRWEMWDMIDKSTPAPLLDKIEHVGKVIGSASLFVSIDAKMKSDAIGPNETPHKVLGIERPFAPERAEQGFQMIDGLINVLERKSNSFSPDFAKNLHEMAQQAKDMIAIETNADIGVAQMTEARMLKGKKLVKLSSPPEGVPAKITFDHAGWSDYGDKFRLMKKMPGESFNSAFGITHYREHEDGIDVTDKSYGKLENMALDALPGDLQTRLSQKQAYAGAHWMMMMENILAGKGLEQDAHGGNWHVDASTGSINSFDDGMIHATQDKNGTVTITKPTEQDLKDLGTVICSAINPLLKSSGKDVSIESALNDGLEKVRSHHGGALPDHMLRIERALIALNDTTHYVPQAAKTDILISLYKNKKMHPIVQGMVNEELGFANRVMVNVHNPKFAIESTASAKDKSTPAIKWERRDTHAGLKDHTTPRDHKWTTESYVPPAHVIHSQNLVGQNNGMHLE